MESKASAEEKVLGRGDLIALAIGNVIGGGIMSLTGIAIGITGRSIVIALVICAIMVLISGLPQFFASSAIRMNGGFYTQAALFGGKYFSGVYAAVFISFFFGGALYSLSFADYILHFVPGVNTKVVSVGLLTLLTVLNLLGIKVAAKVQYAMVILLVLALLAFSFFGFGHVKPGFTEQPDWMRGGFGGIMSAAALMSFAMSGSTMIVNFGRQCKKPTRDIPLAIIVSSVVVMVLYILVAIVASGVFPVDTVANKSLAITAEEVLPYPVYLFFMIFGAIFALVTSLNALLGWIAPPIVQACDDGWFPKVLGKRNEKFHSPHWVLLIIYVLAASILIFGWNIITIADVGNFLSNVLTVVICLVLIRMPKVVPEAWSKSKFRIGNAAYIITCVLGAAVCVVFCYFLYLELSHSARIGIWIYLAAALAYPGIRLAMKKNIEIETSYEEA